jgi:hypothetical protein
MQIWKILNFILFGAHLELKAKNLKSDSVQHLEKCLELEQPIIIHYLSKIEEDE